jgi:hypothetical protein
MNTGFKLLRTGTSGRMLWIMYWTSVSINGGKFIDEMKDYYLLKDSVSWCYLGHCTNIVQNGAFSRQPNVLVLQAEIPVVLVECRGRQWGATIGQLCVGFPPSCVCHTGRWPRTCPSWLAPVRSRSSFQNLNLITQSSVCHFLTNS